MCLLSLAVAVEEDFLKAAAVELAECLITQVVL
jgi:hypothetical protein